MSSNGLSKIYFGKSEAIEELIKRYKKDDNELVVLNSNIFVNNEEESLEQEEKVIETLERQLAAFKYYRLKKEIKFEKSSPDEKVFYDLKKTLNAMNKRVSDFNKFLKESGFDIIIDNTNVKYNTIVYENFEMIPISLKLKLGIAIWLFNKKKLQKIFTLILNQLECHMDDENLNAITEMIICLKHLEIVKSLKLSIILTTHSQKNLRFYKTSKTLYTQDDLFLLKNNSEISLKCDESYFEFNECSIDCEHGYIKRFEGQHLTEYFNTLNLVSIMQSYLWLNDIVWESIPKFSVITGKNGVGKTRFLNFLKITHPSSLFISFEPNIDQKLEFELNLNNIFNEYNTQLNAYHDKNSYFQKSRVVIYESINESVIKDKDNYRLNRFYHHDFIVRSAIIKSNLDKFKISNLTEILTITLYLEKPIDRLNEFLNLKKFKYTIAVLPYLYDDNKIKNIDINTNVFFQLKNSESKINYLQLSSGERIMLYLYLWEYLIKNGWRFLYPNNCLMIDEPDSHLHPSKAKEMIEFIQNKLVKEMNFQVIITTHHPVTASFVNDENLFLMYLTKDGKVNIKNAKNCSIHPIDHLADNLFILSKPQIFVYVEDNRKKIFLQQINKQVSLMSLRSKNESNFFKLFHYSKFEPMCYQGEIINSSFELDKLKTFLNETFKKKLEELKKENDDSNDDNNIKKMVNMFKKKITSCVQFMCNSFFDPFYFDMTNKYAKIIDYFLNDTERLKSKAELNEYINLVSKIVGNFRDELDIFDNANVKKELRSKQIKRNLISSVQDGNYLKLNKDSFSIGYVKQDFYFNTKEFLVYELRDIENYLFDPLNVVLVLIKFEVVYSKQWNSKFFSSLKLNADKPLDAVRYQEVLDTIIKKLTNDKSLKEDVVEVDLINSDSEVSTVKYPKFIFDLKRELIQSIHSTFCDFDCSFQKEDFNDKCFFRIVIDSYKSSNYFDAAEDIYSKLTYGLLNEIQMNDIDILIPFELIERFHYMELYIKHKYSKEKNPVQNFFTDNKLNEGYLKLQGKTDKKNIEKSFLEEIILYNELKDDKMINEFENFIYLFIPDVSFITPVHILVQQSEFKLFKMITEQFKKKIGDLEKSFTDYMEDKSKMSTHVKIIISVFKVLESFKNITEYEFDSYVDINGLVNLQKKIELSTIEKKELEENIQLFEKIFEIIKQSFKATMNPYHDTEYDDDDE